jgi:hypothetical protein
LYWLPKGLYRFRLYWLTINFLIFWIFLKYIGKRDSPVRYEGGREIDDFVKYISKHATEELRGFDRSGNPKKIKEEL